MTTKEKKKKLMVECFGLKGASIIRMLENVLGTDVFFKGLQKYLKKYSFSNAETNDLWDCLTQAARDEQQKVYCTTEAFCFLYLNYNQFVSE